MQKNTFYATGLILNLLCLALLIHQPSAAQDIAIGQWRHHLPSNMIISLAEKDNFVYAATPYGLLEYDKRFNSIKKYTKVEGLSGFGINVIGYSEQRDLLLIGYDNGTIDVMKDGRFFSIPDIRQANILGSRSINNFFFDGNSAYLSCGFGVVVLDLNLFVILDTWFIGPDGSMLNVSDITKTPDRFYAATEAGLLTAPIQGSNLADYKNWLPAQGLAPGRYNLVEYHNNRVFANLSISGSDSLYYLENNSWQLFNPPGAQGFFHPRTNMRSANGFLLISSLGRVHIFDQQAANPVTFSTYAGVAANAHDLLVDRDNIVWAADRSAGLIKGGLDGNFQSILLDGPVTNSSFGVAHNGTALFVATGAIVGTSGNAFSDRGVYFLYDGKWGVFDRRLFQELWETRDFHHVTIHPGNPRRVLTSMWFGGLAEFDIDEGLVAFYNETNSTLQKRAGANDIIRIGGTAFDSRGNLWVSNSDADHFLSVRKTDNTWLSFPHNGRVEQSESLSHVVIDNADQKWVTMPRGGGILVFKESNLNGNQSFDIRKLGTAEGNGSLPSGRVKALAKDKDGYIWVGTDLGVVVFYSPQAALRNQSIDAQNIIVVQDGFAARLFDGEAINTIFVDGSNKKWFGTVSSGAFLQSSDGRETILHFTTRNSPLPSNNILSITVDPVTGEVFFATDRGLVSYRGFATEGRQQHTDVYAFPNPVRPGYEGYIAIKGLVTNARVKITDIAGNLVHDGFADGGQFIWNGKGLHGQKPSSGVYLVFSTNADGTETMVTKLLFIK